MKILATGLNGLVGSRLKELLKDTYEFENVSRSTGVDVTNPSQVEEKIRSSDADIILHLAAKTDVDGCEKDKELGEDGEAWKINVTGTKNVAQAATNSQKKIIFISTDFVFDGNISENEFYTEDDAPNPLNWYAKTKYEGEKIISALNTPWLILRIAYPYRANFEKGDFFRAIKGRLESGQGVKAITDHYFAPTFIDDIANCLDVLIKNNANGIFHAVGGQIITPFDGANAIADVFGLNKNLISETTRAEFFQDRAVRPFRLALKNARIKNLGIEMKGFHEGLLAIKEQII